MTKSLDNPDYRDGSEYDDLKKAILRLMPSDRAITIGWLKRRGIDHRWLIAALTTLEVERKIRIDESQVVTKFRKGVNFKRPMEIQEYNRTAKQPKNLFPTEAMFE